MTNAVLKPGFSQVCVWPATVVGDQVEAFEQHMFDKMGVRVQYLEEVVTGPGEGGPGGRNDVRFAIHDEDIGKFAVPRLSMGISWIEDVFANGGGVLYPDRIREYKTWSAA